MRVIFQCYQCKLIIEYDADDMVRVNLKELPYPPKGWKHSEHIDGMHYWLCGKCSGKNIPAKPGVTKATVSRL